MRVCGEKRGRGAGIRIGARHTRNNGMEISSGRRREAYRCAACLTKKKTKKNKRGRESSEVGQQRNERAKRRPRDLKCGGVTGQNSVVISLKRRLEQRSREDPVEAESMVAYDLMFLYYSSSMIVKKSEARQDKDNANDR